MTQIINLFLKNQHDVVLVCRDSKGKRFTKTITHHRPYMFIEDENGPYIDLYGKKLKKIVYNSPIEVKNNRDNYSKTWESDIIYVNRVLIDEIEKIEKAPLRLLNIDIETTGKSDIDTTIEQALDPITCISALDNFSGKLVTFVWHPKIPINKNTTEIFYFNKEEDMLNKFIDFIVYIDPDLFVGWNICNFDIQYLYYRCKKLGVKFNKISMNGSIKFREFVSYFGGEQLEWDISGRYVFDLMRGYRGLALHELDSYSLKEVAKIELKDNKLEIEESFEDLWNNNIEKLIAYNQKDVILLHLLNNQVDIIDVYDERRIEYGCQWTDLWQTTKWQDIVFLRECKGNIILPRKPTFQLKEDAGKPELLLRKKKKV